MPNNGTSAPPTESYNALGWRVEATEPSGAVIEYLHDAAGNMVGGSANGGPGTSTQYVYFRGGLLAQYWNGQGLWFAHLNGLGSTQQFTDYTGGNKRATMFYPFGQPGPSGSGSGSYLQALWSGFEDGDFWATSEWQTDTRRYTPGASRWYTPDPIGKAAARLDFPQTWNMYTYVQNNPTTLTDPSGQCDWCQRLINWAAGDGFVPNSKLASSTQNTPVSNTRLKPLAENRAAADKNPAVLKVASSKDSKTGGEIQYDLVKAPGDRQNYQISQAESNAPRSNDPSGVSVSEFPNQFLDAVNGGVSAPNSIQTFFMTPTDRNGIPTGPPQPVNIQDMQGNTFYSLGVYMNQTDYRTYVNGQMVNSPSFVPPPGGQSSY